MGTVGMLGGLFSRQSRHTPVPPPPKIVEPPLIPSQEKRQEKERRWIESISTRNFSKRGGPVLASPLPAPVEFIKRDQPASELRYAGPEHAGIGKNGLFDRWDTSHRRGHTAGSSTPPSHTASADNRSLSLRTTRSASALASKMRITRRSKEGKVHKSFSSSSSMLLDPAAPAASSLYPPALSQLGGEGDAAFVHVPQLSPSSALLPPSSLSFASAKSNTHPLIDRSYLSPKSSQYASSSGHGHGTRYPAASQSSSSGQSRLSKVESTKRLAARLQELEHANNVGLLDDEEYRVLRQNLFENNVNSTSTTGVSLPHAETSVRPTDSLGDSRHHATESDTQLRSTGSLLGLPHLTMASGASGDIRVDARGMTTVSGTVLESSHLQFPESSASVHSRTSRLSLRSPRSSLSMSSGVSQVSRIFRRGGSSASATPATPSGKLKRASRIYRGGKEERPPLPNSSVAVITASLGGEDSESLRGMPASIGRCSTKESTPSHWKQLHQSHLLQTEREETKLHKGTQDASHIARGSIPNLNLDIEDERSNVKTESRYRTMRRRSMNVEASKPVADSPQGSDAEAQIPGVEGGMACSHPPFAASKEPSRQEGDGSHFISTLIDNEGCVTGNTSMIPVQPGDEDLESVGLKLVINALREENQRLLGQFDQIEKTLHERYGVRVPDAMHWQTLQRRESPSLQSNTARRSSTASSVFSSQCRSSMMGHPKATTGSLPPLFTLSRQPSRASSIASSSMRRGLNNSNSTQYGSMVSHTTTRPPSTAEEEIMFVATDFNSPPGGLKEPFQPLYAKVPQFDKEYRDLEARKRNVQERYAARLEYLEAKLQGQLNKEKLRR